MCSSRGGSVPMATRTLRRCSTGLPAGSSSSSVVGERRFPAEVTQDRAGAALLSSQFSTVSGRSCPGEGVVEGLQFRADRAAVRRRAGHGAAGRPSSGRTRPWWSLAGLPAARAAVPEGGIGAGAGRAQRLAGGPAADRADVCRSRRSGPIVAGRRCTTARR